MNTQALGQMGGRNLHLQDLAPGPLGTTGNLRFTPQQGGTEPARCTGMFPRSSQLERLRLHFSVASTEVRAQRAHYIEVSENSRRIGNLLGSLTARADDAAAVSRIAKGLAQISALSQGDLSNLEGGTEALSIYMGALTHPDLLALGDGIFSRPRACDAMLEQISPDQLRSKAADVLSQVAVALYQRLAEKIVSEPLRGIVDALADMPANGERLVEQLIRLCTGLAMTDSIGVAGRLPTISMLDIHLESLSEDKLAAQLIDLRQEKLEAAASALLLLSDGPGKQQAQTMLERLRVSLGREMYARVQPRLQQVQESLIPLKAVPREIAALSKMMVLAEIRDNHLEAYGWMPAEMVKEMRELMHEGMEIVFESHRRQSQIPSNSVA